jgi:hypothetical protein
VASFVEAKAAAEAAVAAANAAVAAANAAVAAEEAAQAGLSQLTITDAIGNLIQAAVLGGPAPQTIRDAWQDFLDSCAAALGGLGFDVGKTAANIQAKALAEQAAAVAANMNLTLANLQTTAAASAAAVAPAQANLITAQAALDAADVMILVPGMQDVMDAVFKGLINPGELSISRVISDQDQLNAATDIVEFSGNLADYTIVQMGIWREVTDTVVGRDGRDLVRNVERLRFADQDLVLDPPGNNAVAVGQPTISGAPIVGSTLTASIAGVTDADNVSTGGAVTRPVDWIWQVELDPGTGVFTPIVRVNGAGDDFEVHGESLVLTADEVGLQVRVVGMFQDEALVFERVTSAPVTVN